MTEAASAPRPGRGTIFVEDAVLTEVHAFAGQQFVLRLNAPRCARTATAGSFVHLRCDDALPMRRPLSIMRAGRNAGWIEILFKVVGAGLRSLAQRRPGDELSLLGPIGNGFQPQSARPRALLLGGGVGVPPIIFLAEQMQREAANWQPTVLLGSELPFPFEVRTSALPAAWLPDDIVSTMGLLEDLGISTRLASCSGFGGCFDGHVTDLARTFLQAQSAARLAQTEVFCCGPTPMLRAVAALAQEFGLPCQASLEEYMACAVGGCAGCTVLVQTDAGPAMRRVCVDGPVFPAGSVFPPA